MKFKNYNLGNLISEVRDLDKLQTREYISGICTSLVDYYSEKYILDEKRAINLVYDLTEIYCEDHISKNVIKKN